MSNIKEQIKAEIERQLEYFKGKEDDAWDDCDKYTDEDAQWYQGHWKMCSRLLSFIDSLPEEKPCENLNDEIKKFIEEYGYERGEDKLLIAIVARHFAKWQAEKCDEETSKLLYAERQTAYINGWDDHKKQMMKDAVEGEVIYDLGGFFRIKSEAIDGAKYKVGSWVKLIIVKED